MEAGASWRCSARASLSGIYIEKWLLEILLLLAGPARRGWGSCGNPWAVDGGRDFQRLWEGPGASGRWPGAFHIRSASTAWGGGLASPARAAPGESPWPQPGLRAGLRSHARTCVQTCVRLPQGRVRSCVRLARAACRPVCPGGPREPPRLCVRACVAAYGPACGSARKPQSRVRTCVQTCVRLSGAACGPACGLARPAEFCGPHPPPAPSDQLSRGWGSSESGTKPPSEAACLAAIRSVISRAVTSPATAKPARC